MFGFKKISKVWLEMEKLKNGKSADLTWLLRELNASKSAWADISESLIKTLDDIHIKSLAKNADYVAEFVKDMFKVLSKIT
jgi:hypothetical protein